MKIAWFTPFRRDGSGVGLVSAAACDGLRADHDLVVFASDLTDPRDACRPDLPIVSLVGADPRQVARGLDEFPLVVYNLGDHVGFHRSIYDVSRLRRGIVILHDLVMRDFFAGYYLEPGAEDPPALLALMEQCHGASAAAWLQDLMAGRIADLWADPHVLEYHMARAAVRHAHGVVVHSEFSRARVAALAGAPVVRLDFPTPDLAEEALRWEPPPAGGERPIDLLTFGYVNRNKRVDQVIEALGSSPLLRRRARYTVVGAIGEPSYRDHLHALVQRLGLGDAVRFVGPKFGDALHQEIRAADVVVNLRNPHLGESSWSLLESLFAAKPTIVWNHGSYAELPDDVVGKVAAPHELAPALEALVGDDRGRLELGRRAREYARRTFRSARYAQGLVEFAAVVTEQRAALDFTDRVAALIGEMGGGAVPSRLLDRVATELALLADVGPASRRTGGARERPSRGHGAGAA